MSLVTTAFLNIKLLESKVQEGKIYMYNTYNVVYDCLL